VLDLCRRRALAIILALASTICAAAQQKAMSGTFVLHKFARAIGNESYSIEAKGETYVLTSHFLFTDRGSKVPLETTFIADIRDMTPRSYSARGKASRFADMEDRLTVDGNAVSISTTRSLIRPLRSVKCFCTQVRSTNWSPDWIT
jgi:hypothetical protein